MTVTVKHILQLINEFAPFHLAEKWDNCGLQAGNLCWPVKKIMTCLDVTMDVLNAAKLRGVDLILSHHPLMITPTNQLDFEIMPGAAIAFAAKEKISILSAHTNLDKTPDGLNDYFSNIIGLKAHAPLLSFDHDLIEMGDQRQKICGIGRIGVIDPPVTVYEMAEFLKNNLNTGYVRIVGNLNLIVKHIAVCTGSGGSLVKHFLSTEADLFITGDLKYHEAMDVIASQKAAIDVGHFGSEHMVTTLLLTRLQQVAKLSGYKIEIYCYKDQKDPFIIL